MKDLIKALSTVSPRQRAPMRLVEETSEWGYIMAHEKVGSPWGVAIQR